MWHHEEYLAWRQPVFILLWDCHGGNTVHDTHFCLGLIQPRLMMNKLTWMLKWTGNMQCGPTEALRNWKQVKTWCIRMKKYAFIVTTQRGFTVITLCGMLWNSLRYEGKEKENKCIYSSCALEYVQCFIITCWEQCTERRSKLLDQRNAFRWRTVCELIWYEIFFSHKPRHVTMYRSSMRNRVCAI